MYEPLIFKMLLLLVLSLGILLIAIFPLIGKVHKGFATVSLVGGLSVILLLLFIIFGHPVLREAIFTYGLSF
ncbi:MULTISPECIES: hypothetical protein [Brevibacillus]|uniref:hypothetical protein n=1 Tax=Brevibacillus TaxID=55080 RepID=UPI000D0E4752|nr:MULTISPECIES: hypothetical protein [Brevibacillus]PSJ69513.1 hypothetical protein C7J99_08840 [Brevibacillus brevis]RED23029.1 hypothetical protein DES34_1152 [Brevibacillus brevis]TQK74950.1 hypothetical protein FB479_101561 [Brevibacillus sp. AG162]VEF87411.1 Uncharacterised protein [Brevibacillus brevis]GEC93849.1 hypothetical protein BBR01nite_61800 [Brevibacillus brevis]